ncbi:hypothetical protein AB4Z09_03775 [Rhodococcus sp. TAF43]|uniref:hypothetical protein n=1 Tax=unclassified Rhodococcus (in: high G+C Gram-positive bacteria) TaxID=192944 RepID=UPI0015842FDB|nr:hypothetical protein [Rhodococcus sp. W8901]QKT12838.1 hypothetical protein HUN07_20850 [Rhodococcus sp. W8901]
MKRSAAALNRLLVLVVGLALAAAGATALAWDRGVTAIRDAVANFDRDRLIEVPDQSWWHAALAVTIGVSLVLAVVVLAVDLTRRRASPSQFLESRTDTPVSIDLGPIANGVATELAQLPGVRRARGRALSDRGLATIQVTVEADPHSDVAALTRASERIAATTTSALGGTAVADVAIRILLHLDRADHPPVAAPATPGPQSTAGSGAD